MIIMETLKFQFKRAELKKIFVFTSDRKTTKMYKFIKTIMKNIMEQNISNRSIILIYHG